VPSKLLWGINIFDPNMVFRDIETKEVFVFDSNGTNFFIEEISKESVVLE
jgi:hypothetical protein